MQHLLAHFMPWFDLEIRDFFVSDDLKAIEAMDILNAEAVLAVNTEVEEPSMKRVKKPAVADKQSGHCQTNPEITTDQKVIECSLLE